MVAIIIHSTLNGELIKKFSATCSRCNHTWKPRNIIYNRKYNRIDYPVVCSKCRSAYWNKIKGTRKSDLIKEIME